MLVNSCIIPSPLGPLKIEGSAAGLTAITILHAEATSLANQKKLTATVPESLQTCVWQLQEYFEGNRKQFNLLLNPLGTPFQKMVWQAVASIPFGKTVSYSFLSGQLGNVRAVRAVANAIGKNPLLIVVPCHRVIGANGSLTGYAGGLLHKKWLLNHESAYKQQYLFKPQ
ncbi:methylated-DNA--[protein]-cysteine S-methyltransferase [Bizionia sediminis]|uniref:Methylated-DNA--protein-cysteine methyltransferase n=1 Tax=Bizionia sediminis TaxID=1737064 RepID=A0ABW5KTM1_9FLAO